MTELARATQDPSDLALIDRWLGGDERAATALVERHAQPLARFAASLGEWEQVDELVQDTFVRAFGSLESFRREWVPGAREMINCGTWGKFNRRRQATV